MTSQIAAPPLPRAAFGGPRSPASTLVSLGSD